MTGSPANHTNLRESRREHGVDWAVGCGRHEKDNYLDAIFHNVFTRNPERLRAWLSASHIERAPKRAKKEEAVPESELAQPQDRPRLRSTLSHVRKQKPGVTSHKS